MKIKIFYYFVHCPPLASQLPNKVQHVYIPSLPDLISCCFPVHANISLIFFSILFLEHSKHVTTSGHFHYYFICFNDSSQDLPLIAHSCLSDCQPIREAFPGDSLLKFTTSNCLPFLCVIFLQSIYHNLVICIYLFVHCLSPPTGLLHNKNKGFVVYSPFFTP